MQKLIEKLKEFGIEIPAEKESDIKKALSEHYKNAIEFEKTVRKIETERDEWKKKAEDAQETLKKFEGIDPAEIQKELDDWKEKAEKAEQDYKEQLAQRDFEDALKTEMESYAFTSEAAKKSVMADIRAAGLKLKDGKILGLSDLIDQMKKEDATAFVDAEHEDLEKHKAKPFTKPLGGKLPQTSAEKFKAMSLDERMALKASNPDEYERLRKGE